MLKSLLPVTGDTVVPPATEVVIVGGGIIGVAAALSLTESGVPVCLFEKGEIGAEQSGRNWGWVRKMGRVEQDIDMCIMGSEQELLEIIR